jgi:WD40 repeat protein
MNRKEHLEPKNTYEHWVTQEKELTAQLSKEKDHAEKLKLKKKIAICKQEINKTVSPIGTKSQTSLQKRKIDWGEALTDEAFYGRDDELSTLFNWISIKHEHCRLIAILGMGGIGKTSLIVELIKRIENDFDQIVWRSLRDQPSVEWILKDIYDSISNNQEFESELPIGKKITLLIEELERKRCLIILDNFESILKEGKEVGYYKQDYGHYGDLLKRVASVQHNSCLILTSREKPKEVVYLEGEKASTRSLLLSGLKLSAVKRILSDKRLVGSNDDWKHLVEERYVGNPLALKIVSEYIRELFDGNILDFLKTQNVIIGDIRSLLDQQFDRLSVLENLILYWLSVEREPTSILTLSKNIIESFSEAQIFESLNALIRRNLIQKTMDGFTLQNMIMEYVTRNLVTNILEEINSEDIQLFNSVALTKAQSKEYIRHNQRKLISKHVVNSLLLKSNMEEVLKKLEDILRGIKVKLPRVVGYAGSNVLNLLSELNTSLDRYDFSELAIRQANLQGIELHNVNFASCIFQDCIFADTFGSISSVTFNSDGRLIAAGSFNGQIRIWKADKFTQLVNYEGHNDWISSVCFSPKGGVLASASGDQTIKLWEVITGKCVGLLKGHKNRVRSIAFHPNGHQLASASEDHTIRIWDLDKQKCIRIINNHEDRVKAVCFSPNAKMIASAGDDRKIRLWDAATYKCLVELNSHSGWIRALAFSPDSKKILSGDDDGSLKLWNTDTGNCELSLQADDNRIWSVDFSLDGSIIACGGGGGTIKLWDATDGRLIKTLMGHSSWVRSINFHPQGSSLISGGEDQTIRLWDLKSGQCLRTIRGYTKRVFSLAYAPNGKFIVAGLGDHKLHLWRAKDYTCVNTLSGHKDQVWTVSFSPSGKFIASGSDDQTVKLWDFSSGRCVQTLTGHEGWIGSVAFDNKESLVASGGDDKIIILWNIHNGQRINVLRGHEGRISSLSFSPDNHIVASSSEDGTIKLWNVSNGNCIATLKGHTSLVFSVAFSPKENLLASGSSDHTVRLWDITSYKELMVLTGHDRQVWSVSFSPNGRMLASCSDDKTVRLWDVSSSKCIKILAGHKRQVWSVTFSPNGDFLASGSEDETVRIWNVATGGCIKVLEGYKTYEGMNISNSEGLTEAQIVSLKALGAIGY